ncbi:hypothetical protein GCM10023185_03800 [Hymenobacter saemangeumensis]|uniref:DUF4878 domain-containing protein n=1 Tax=Hymenobacter saemangeumensis TaxID=1084522 RepID=A0ABP8HZE4_9BACT
MRTSLLLLLAALSLSTAATAQTTLLAAHTSTTLSAPDPGTKPEARSLITQVVEAELQTPALQKSRAKLVYVDIKGDAATARVEQARPLPVRSYYYHLRLQDGQWVITGRDNSPQVKL